MWDEEFEKWEEKNKTLCEKYPFLAKYDSKGEPWYYSTHLDDLPKGWRNAFGIQMCDEILEFLNNHPDFKEKYKVLQVKEKYSSLRWYDTPYNQELDSIIYKYIILSEITCSECGEPATRLSRGYVLPFCDTCAANSYEEWKPEYMCKFFDKI